MKLYISNFVKWVIAIIGYMQPNPLDWTGNTKSICKDKKVLGEIGKDFITKKIQLNIHAFLDRKEYTF